MALLSRYKAMEKENIGLSNELETKANLCKFCMDMFPGGKANIKMQEWACGDNLELRKDRLCLHY